ncbi:MULTISPECIES: LysR family transcriptional regulator [Mesorhizobium]|uniref:LysR family transcriptional regulator n=10 Tax=Mesorhizobium TaxID=68287 RepID=A0AB38TI93_9HYPH|nr:MULTISPECIES: LysR family transcriptional regulator [Mesorhizobium]MDF3212447.1 LysR family transcriptional regulator [Mesorhizobium ciceri]RUZ06447.1 LysR family transcriptional regulator [Mesorhizobium sp. M7A.F.Ca.CA.001.04.2.1]RUZ17339.1 LysR family transcriptional regulator [Mesorhizobium sp. M7A.F.Ca.CA.001.09.1.1]RUZ30915.1 LysR family transcriptional regulator [Mesorhizobium sp. M7A.F.Ca.CA.001.04.1.1]RUZ86902.1 LysR family transcriptional regulator [Mesorhizobium sp. M7A.F.Ca.CA.00
MHPRLLKTFLAVARSRNITRAAEVVHLAQSSVSDQILALEAELGAALFTRAKSGLELTPAGLALQPIAEDLLRLDGEARAAVQAAAGSTSGHLTIGALETIASARLAPWLPGFQAGHPDITVRMKVAGSGALLRQLEDGDIDVAFCFDRRDFAKGASDKHFARRTIAAEPLVLVAAPGQGSVPGDLAALGELQFVATEPGCIYRHMFDTAFAEAGAAAPRLANEVGSIGAIARLVAAGAGLALVPRLAVPDALARGDIVEMRWPGQMRTAPLVMIWRRRRVQLPALKQLLTAARDTLVPALQPAKAGSGLESSNRSKALFAKNS